MEAILERYNIDPSRGFLGAEEPLRRLPPDYEAWEELMDDLPSLLQTERLRDRVYALPELAAPPPSSGERILRRAMLVLSMLSHAFVFQGAEVGTEPVSFVPPVLAKPWTAVAGTLGRVPVLSAASIILDNWRLLDPHGPIDVSNLAVLNTFLGSSDEAWFYLCIVQIEAQAAPALNALLAAQAAIRDQKVLRESSVDDIAGLARMSVGSDGSGDDDDDDDDDMDGVDGVVLDSLRVIVECVDRMIESLDVMCRKCAPDMFYHRVRLYLNGWKGNESLPNGICYQSVPGADVAPVFAAGRAKAAAAARRPESDTSDFVAQYCGGSAAQSAVFQALDAGLGIDHTSEFLEEMREYMEPGHAAFLSHLAQAPSIRDAATRAGGSVLEMYNTAVQRVADLRTEHIKIVCRYVVNPGRASGRGIKGTGGTRVMPFLKSVRNSTLSAVTNASPSSSGGDGNGACASPSEVPSPCGVPEVDVPPSSSSSWSSMALSAFPFVAAAVGTAAAAISLSMRPKQ